MKQFLICTALLALTTSSAWSQTQRTCGTVYDQAYLNSLTPQERSQSVEFRSRAVQSSDKSNGVGTQSASSAIPDNQTIFIPVVVHVLFNASVADDNISDAQICSQIDVLNEDYGRRNGDRGNTPADFQSLSANTRIQFYLATRDPNGNPTNGITRTQTTLNRFTSDGEEAKFTFRGGQNAWDSNRLVFV